MNETTWETACLHAISGCKGTADDTGLCAEHRASAKAAANGTYARPAQSKDEIKAYLRNRRDATRELEEEEAGEIHIPAFTSLTALLGEPDDPTPFRIEGLLPSEGRVITAAEMKSGKTTLTGNLVRSLADGEPFLDAFKTEPVAGRVVVIDTEMSRRQLRRWMRDQGIQNTDHVEVLPLRGLVGTFTITNAAVRALWADELRQLEAEVIILDPLNPVLNAMGADENSNSEVGKVLDAFDALVKEAGASELIIMHHAGHNGERSRGASKLRGWPDAEWKLLIDKDENGYPLPDGKRYFWAYGRDVDTQESELEYDTATRRLSLATDAFGMRVTGGRDKAKRARKLDAIEEFVTANPGCKTGEIAGKGITTRNRAELIAELIRTGRIHTVTEGRTTRHYPGTAPEPSPDDQGGEEE